MATPLVSVRVVWADHYMAPPLPKSSVDSWGKGGWENLYRPHQQALNDDIEYPVIRIFGSTPGGQKTCAHVHGALPYLLARPVAHPRDGARPYKGDKSESKSLRRAFDDVHALASFTNRLLWEISSKMQQALERSHNFRNGENGVNGGDAGGGNHGETATDSSLDSTKKRNAWRRRPVIYAVEAVERIPIFGFHPHPLPFLKITLFNPKHVRLLQSLLQSGEIKGTEMQPYEAHINNILQCFIDHDVSGMGYLHLSDIRFRSPMPECSEAQNDEKVTLTGSSDHSMNQTGSSAGHSQRSSPFIKRNDHRLFWAHNTDPQLLADYHSDVSTCSPPLRTPPMETASQAALGVDPEDFELSPDAFGGLMRYTGEIEGRAGAQNSSACGQGQRSSATPISHHQGCESIRDPPVCPLDHNSRSQSALELDTTIFHIQNREMRVCENDDDACENHHSEKSPMVVVCESACAEARNHRTPQKKLKQKTFRAVRSLAEMWTEEKERARRIGLDSQIANPSAASPDDPNVVNQGLSRGSDASRWHQALKELAASHRASLHEHISSSEIAGPKAKDLDNETLEDLDDELLPRLNSMETVFASQHAVDEQARAVRLEELRKIDGAESSEDELEYGRCLPEVHTNMGTPDASTQNSGGTNGGPITSATPSSNGEQPTTGSSQEECILTQITSRLSAASNASSPRRESFFLSQEQQQEIDTLLSQEEGGEMLLELNDTPDSLQDIQEASVEEEHWRSQPSVAAAAGNSNEPNRDDIYASEDEGVAMGQEEPERSRTAIRLGYEEDAHIDETATLFRAASHTLDEAVYEPQSHEIMGNRYRDEDGDEDNEEEEEEEDDDQQGSDVEDDFLLQDGENSQEEPEQSPPCNSSVSSQPTELEAPNQIFLSMYPIVRRESSSLHTLPLRSSGGLVLEPSAPPPSPEYVMESLSREFGLQEHIPVVPFFGKAKDVQKEPLPKHSRRRALPKFKNDVPRFDTTATRQHFYDVHHAAHSYEEETKKRVALPLVVGLEQYRQRVLQLSGCASFEEEFAIYGPRHEAYCLTPAVPPPSPAAVSLWLQEDCNNHGRKLNRDSSSDRGPLGILGEGGPLSRNSGLDKCDDNNDDNDLDEFTTDPNTGALIPNAYHRPKKQSRVSEVPVERIERTSTWVPPHSNLALDSAGSCLLEDGVHPLYETNPERASSKRFSQNAARASSLSPRSNLALNSVGGCLLEDGVHPLYETNPERASSKRNYQNAARASSLPPRSNLALDGAGGCLLEDGAHPLYEINPERASSKGFSQTAARASSLRRLSMERTTSPLPVGETLTNAAKTTTTTTTTTTTGAEDASSPLTSSPKTLRWSPTKMKSPDFLPRQPQLEGDTLPTMRTMTRSYLRQQSQVPSPTQTGMSGLSATGKDMKGAAFQLSGAGSTVSSSVGRRVSILCVEIIAATRYQLLPDPAQDKLLGVVWSVHDTFGFDSETEDVHRANGVIVNMEEEEEEEREGSSGGERKEQQQQQEEDGEEENPSRGAKKKPSWHEAVGTQVEVEECKGEVDTFLALEALFYQFDPDVVVGWDIERASLKWLLNRAANLSTGPLDFVRRLSRVPNEARNALHGNDEWGETSQSDVHLTGRVCLTLWRLMRSELKLNSYTLENVVAKVLHRRIPQVLPYNLSAWWRSGAAGRARALRLVLGRAKAALLVLEKLDLVNRYSESARLYGIPLFDVVSRGSQYRVEAVMLRVMKPLNFAAPSPSKAQVANQASIEVIPLVLEPDSRFYTDPVVVLDFQSLYPSMVLAYNLCYSTCLGRLTHPGDSRGPTTGKLGFTPYPTAKTAAALADQCGLASHASPSSASSSVSSSSSSSPSSSLPFSSSSSSSAPPCRPHLPFVLPTGAAFVPRDVREGVLPRMLREILDTRFMVKRAMKRCLKQPPPLATSQDRGSGETKSGGSSSSSSSSSRSSSGGGGDGGGGGGLTSAQRRTLENVLHARQLALKMIANVTYGYTAASFSGRMPCSELADAIVKAGRSTLEHAIALVEAETHRWSGAKVVYG